MSEVTMLEKQREDIMEIVDLKDAALRLAENRDFRKIFTELYFRDEAARLVQMAGDPTLKQDARDDALAMALATGHTKRYLSMIVQRAYAVERDLEELDETLAIARQEEDNIELVQNEGSVQ